ncbi:MAG: hypothetical protein ACPGNT_02500, partial [Rhodospirillales bacterium]
IGETLKSAIADGHNPKEEVANANVSGSIEDAKQTYRDILAAAPRGEWLQKPLTLPGNAKGEVAIHKPTGIAITYRPFSGGNRHEHSGPPTVEINLRPYRMKVRVNLD